MTGDEADVARLWDSRDPRAWEDALKCYWDRVRRSGNLKLEQELDSPGLIDRIRAMNEREWYEFLRDEYFPWKFQHCQYDPAKHLRSRETKSGLKQLHTIKQWLLNTPAEPIERAFDPRRKIPGLAVPGMSGLLSLMFPKAFAAVDQFVVASLQRIPTLPEAFLIAGMNSSQLSVRDAVILIRVMRQEAAELNQWFRTDAWTPRRIDMVLWASRE